MPPLLHAPPQVCAAPGVLRLLAPKVTAGMASAVFAAIFPLVAQQQLKLDSRQNGLMTSFVGLLVAVGEWARLSVLPSPCLRSSCVLVAPQGFARRTCTWRRHLPASPRPPLLPPTLC